MTRKRRNRSLEFKAKVGLAAAKVDKAAMIFASESQLGKRNSEEVDKLHAKVGQLTMEIDFWSKCSIVRLSLAKEFAD